MNYNDPLIGNTLLYLIEIFGTFAWAVSGIRQAAAKHFDWFGGFVCGIVVAIGGGTVRDIMLAVPPFWMTDSMYLIVTVLAQISVIVFATYLKKLDNAWFVFDTLGLALFTLVGIEKTLAYGHPMWVAVVMGCITGSAGGVIRDLLLNTTPIIFKRELYAMACVIGGFAYWGFTLLNLPIGIVFILTFVTICIVRYLAVRYDLGLPTLQSEDNNNSKNE